MRTLENALRRYGFHRIAGVDESRPAGAWRVRSSPRPWSSTPGGDIPGIHDSKMVTALERERLYGVITRKALAWSVASAQPAEIDDINIHRASLEAMRRAVSDAAHPAGPRAGRRVPHSGAAHGAQRGVLHGDQALHRALRRRRSWPR